MKCERCTLDRKQGRHGLGICPLEPKHSPLRFSTSGKKHRTDPETLIQEYGAEKLSQTNEGVKILERAREKYRVELLQPHEPEFQRYWGKDVERRKREMQEIRAQSQRMKREAGMV